MRMHIVIALIACIKVASGQPTASPVHRADQTHPAEGRSQQQADARPNQQKEDFFTSSTKMVNKSDVDYGAML